MTDVVEERAQLSALINAMREQTEQFARLAEAILALAVAAERSAGASLLLLDTLTPVEDADDDVRDMSGKRVLD